MRPDHVGGGHNFFVTGLETAVAQILAHRARKQVGGLQHHPNAGLNRVQGQVGVITAANENLPLARLVKAAHQVHNGGFTRPCRANQGNRLALLHRQVEILQHGFVLFIIEGHIVEDDVPLNMRHFGRIHLVGNLGFHIEEREDAFGRGDGLLHTGKHPRHLLHRPEHEGDVGDKRLNRADAQRARLELIAAQPHHPTNGKGHDELHGRQEQRRKPRRSEGSLVHIPRQPFKFAQVFFFPPQRLHHPHPSDVFAVGASDFGVELAHFAVFAQDAHLEFVGDEDEEGNHHGRNQPQLPVDKEHKDEGNDDIRHPPRNVEEPPRHQLPHPLRVRGHARHEPPERGAVVVGEGQGLQVVKNPLAQVILHTLAQVARTDDEPEDQPSLHNAQQPILQHQTVQPIHVFGNNAFINDQLAEVGEVGVEERDKADEDQKADHQRPTAKAELGHPPEGATSDIASKFFFFKMIIRHDFLAFSCQLSAVNSQLWG